MILKDIVMASAILSSMGGGYSYSQQDMKRMCKLGTSPKKYGMMLAHSKENRKYRGRRKKRR